MATRSIVAEPRGNDWYGRYVHWDGAPETRLPILQRMVSRDGVTRVREVLLHENTSWSSLCDTQTQLGEYDDEERMTCVANYGVAHTDLPSDDEWEFTKESPEFAWAEYLYILGDESIVVCQWDETCWQPISVEPHPHLAVQV